MCPLATLWPRVLVAYSYFLRYIRNRNYIEYPRLRIDCLSLSFRGSRCWDSFHHSCHIFLTESSYLRPYAIRLQFDYGQRRKKSVSVSPTATLPYVSGCKTSVAQRLSLPYVPFSWVSGWHLIYSPLPYCYSLRTSASIYKKFFVCLISLLVRIEWAKQNKILRIRRK